MKKIANILLLLALFVCLFGLLYLLFETDTERRIVLFFSCLAIASGLVTRVVKRKGEGKNEHSDEDA